SRSAPSPAALRLQPPPGHTPRHRGSRPRRRRSRCPTAWIETAGRRRAERRSIDELGLQVLDELPRADPFLLQGIPIAHRHGLILDGLAVDGDPVRCTGFVLPAIAAPDRPAVVVEDV